MARMSVRQMWAAKIAGKLAPTASPDAGYTLSRPAFSGQVLGIDPSLRGTGLALIEFAAGRQPVLLRWTRVEAGRTATPRSTGTSAAAR